MMYSQEEIGMRVLISGTSMVIWMALSDKRDLPLQRTRPERPFPVLGSSALKTKEHHPDPPAIHSMTSSLLTYCIVI